MTGSSEKRAADASAAQWQRWNRRVLLALATIAATLPVINVAVDPFDIFMLSPIGTGPYMNQRCHHADLLRSGAVAPEVLVLGDSIMGINDPTLLVAGTRYRSAYNASVFMASAVDIRDLAGFIARMDRKPKLVIVGLDTYIFSGQPQPDSFSIKMPPGISGQASAQWWTQALFAPGLFPAYDKAIEKLSGRPSAVFDTWRGHYSRPQLDAEIATDPAAYAKRIFTGVPKAAGRVPASTLQLMAISDAAATLHRAGIPAVWVLQPPSHGLTLMYPPEAIEENFAAIASQLPPGEVLDLSRMRAISDDRQAWYDLKHYQPSAGKIILRAIATHIANTKGRAIGEKA
jgi:hypothetical protein